MKTSNDPIRFVYLYYTPSLFTCNAHTFTSSQRKKVIHDLSKRFNWVNDSLAYNGLVRHGDRYVCARMLGEGTEITMLYFTVDLAKKNPDGPPMITISHLQRALRRLALENRIELPVETYSIFTMKIMLNID